MQAWTNDLAASGLAPTAVRRCVQLARRQGGPIRRSNYRRRVWLPATSAASLPGVRFHDLPHTHVAMLIAEGEHPKLIQTRLGHASIRTTLDLHGHLLEGLDESAAAALDAGSRCVTDKSRTRPTATVVEIGARNSDNL